MTSYPVTSMHNVAEQRGIEFSFLIYYYYLNFEKKENFDDSQRLQGENVDERKSLVKKKEAEKTNHCRNILPQKALAKKLQVSQSITFCQIKKTGY